MKYRINKEHVFTLVMRHDSQLLRKNRPHDCAENGDVDSVYGQDMQMLYKEVFPLTLSVFAQTLSWLAGSLLMFCLKDMIATSV